MLFKIYIFIFLYYTFSICKYAFICYIINIIYIYIKCIIYNLEKHLKILEISKYIIYIYMCIYI